MAREEDSKYFLLGTIPPENDLHICSSRLPTRKQVTLAFLCRKNSMEEGKKKLHQAALETVNEEIMPIYQNARIPTIHFKNMVKKMLILMKK